MCLTVDGQGVRIWQYYGNKLMVILQMILLVLDACTGSRYSKCLSGFVQFPLEVGYVTSKYSVA